MTATTEFDAFLVEATRRGGPVGAHMHVGSATAVELRIEPGQRAALLAHISAYGVPFSSRSRWAGTLRLDGDVDVYVEPVPLRAYAVSAAHALIDADSDYAVGAAVLAGTDPAARTLAGAYAASPDATRTDVITRTRRHLIAGDFGTDPEVTGAVHETLTTLLLDELPDVTTGSGVYVVSETCGSVAVAHHHLLETARALVRDVTVALRSPDVHGAPARRF